MKKRVGVFAGGPSVEHEISLKSAKNIYENLDEALFDKKLIGITKSNKWYYLDPIKFFELHAKGGLFSLEDYPEMILNPCFFDDLKQAIDVAFPILHGALGEDGAFQGLMKCLDIPCVGPSVLDAAICMDKDIMKKLAEQQGMLVVPYITLHSGDYLIDEVIEKLGFPVFVKPATSGSSLGVSKVKNPLELEEAVREAFKFSRKVLIEKALMCREIECAALGNETVLVATAGEVVCHHEFYSYDAKYLDPSGASLAIPAVLSDSELSLVQNLAKRAYLAANCKGMARVDFFMDDKGLFYLNEINTIPGFTSISLYPKLWEHDGMKQTDLVTELVRLGLENYDKEIEINKNALLLSVN